MAMCTAGTRLCLRSLTESSRRAARLFSDDKGRIFSEEERAAENIYIQKMERERQEKLKRKIEKEKVVTEKEKSNKKVEGETHKA